MGGMRRFLDGGGDFPHPPSRENSMHSMPLLFSCVLNIFYVNILLKTGKIHSLIAFHKLFLSHIKVKILINSWDFLIVFSDVLSL